MSNSTSKLTSTGKPVRAFLGIDFYGKLTDSQRRFVRAFIAYMLSSGLSFLADYFTKNPVILFGITVTVAPLLLALSKKVRDDYGIVLPF